MAHHWKEANVPVLQGESGPQEAVPQPLGEAASTLRPAARLDSLFDSLAAAHLVLRPRRQLHSGSRITLSPHSTQRSALPTMFTLPFFCCSNLTYETNRISLK